MNYKARHPIEYGYVEVEADTIQEAIERIRNGEGQFHSFKPDTDYNDGTWINDL